MADTNKKECRICGEVEGEYFDNIYLRKGICYECRHVSKPLNDWIKKWGGDRVISEQDKELFIAFLRIY